MFFHQEHIMRLIKIIKYLWAYLCNNLNYIYLYQTFFQKFSFKNLLNNMFQVIIINNKKIFIYYYKLVNIFSQNLYFSPTNVAIWAIVNGSIIMGDACITITFILPFYFFECSP